MNFKKPFYPKPVVPVTWMTSCFSCVMSVEFLFSYSSLYKNCGCYMETEVRAQVSAGNLKNFELMCAFLISLPDGSCSACLMPVLRIGFILHFII